MIETNEDLSYQYYGPPVTMDQCIFFWGHHGKGNIIGKECLSQWYPSLFKDNHDRTYQNAEQFMMAHKAILFGDHEILSKIMSVSDPKEIKSLGRQIKNYSDEKWKQVRFDVVEKGNILKFSQNKALGDYLLSTGDAYLVEASPFDTVWGIGLNQADAVRTDPYKWGLNLLGLALMNVRIALIQLDK